jgi:hypothetical protein
LLDKIQVTAKIMETLEGMRDTKHIESMFFHTDAVPKLIKQLKYSAFGKSSDPFPFSTLCYISLILKLIEFNSYLNLHTIPHNDEAKTFFFVPQKIEKNKKYLIYISIQTLFYENRK